MEDHRIIQPTETYNFRFHRYSNVLMCISTKNKYFSDDGKDAGVSKAYQTALVLTLRRLDNPEYIDFAARLKERSKLAPFNYEFPEGEEVRLTRTLNWSWINENSIHFVFFNS